MRNEKWGCCRSAIPKHKSKYAMHMVFEMEVEVKCMVHPPTGDFYMTMAMTMTMTLFIYIIIIYILYNHTVCTRLLGVTVGSVYFYNLESGSPEFGMVEWSRPTPLCNRTVFMAILFTV